uniref:Uncharacterized protein n=1 Tax=Plectus sambesii TaxID=2011161 RepID=A0A914WCN3_9BILA
MDECMPAGRRVNSSRLSAELRRGHSLKQLTGEVLTSTEAGGVHVEEAAAALPGRLRAPRLRNRQTASRVGAAGACATHSPSAPHGQPERRTDGETGRQTALTGTRRTRRLRVRRARPGATLFAGVAPKRAGPPDANHAATTAT